MSIVTKEEGVAVFLAAIPEMSRAELLAQWLKDHGRPAPKGISRRLLEYSTAYEAQVRAFGGLKPATKRKLDRIATQPRDKIETGISKKPAKRLTPGARLMREWHGRTHHVEVTEDGYRHDGAIYGSLSEVAREITGARWSGPRFFGL